MLKNSIDVVFANLKLKKQKALIAYLAGNYPLFTEETKLVKAMVAAGVDILEVGIPFSDPIADGPTIQFASQEALKNGASVSKILRWISELKKQIDIPVVVMTYINPVMAYGFAAFAKDAAKAGVSGVIIPDTVPEESVEIRRHLERQKIHLIHLVAPTTPKARQSLIAKKTGGFLYAVSVAGVTGARVALPQETKKWLNHLRTLSDRPVCVGFGISGPEQIRHLRDGVDGFIVGSAIIDIIRKTSPAKRLATLRKFISALSKECTYGR
jgi:tryptophan synthase alpha chain